MKVISCGSTWSHDKRGMIAQVVGGDNQYVKVIWMSKGKGKAGKFEIYSLVSRGKYAFQYWCKSPVSKNLIKEECLVVPCDNDEDDVQSDESIELLSSSLNNTEIVDVESDYDDDESVLEMSRLIEYRRCSNCKLMKHKCLDGQFVPMVKEETIGMRVKAVGSFWSSFMMNKSAIVIGGNSHKIKIHWLHHADNVESHYFGYKYQFQFDCKPIDPPKLSTRAFSKSKNRPSDGAYSQNVVLRLPFRKATKEVWRHDVGGEKHRIMFCASDNIKLRAIGLLVEEEIKRVIFNICEKSTINHDKGFRVIFKQDFDNVVSKFGSTKILHLRHPVPLNSDGMYLLVLTFCGGASMVGYGGEEFISVKTGTVPPLPYMEISISLVCGFSVAIATYN